MTNSIVFGAGLTLALLLLAAPANADAILYLDDLGTAGIDVIVVDDWDGGIGTSTVLGLSNTADGAAGDGIVTFFGAVGSFTVNVTTGLSKPLLGSVPKIDLNSVNVSGAPGTLVIGWSDTDFIAIANPQTSLSRIGGVTDGIVSYENKIDGSNGNFSGAVVASGVFGPGAFSETQAGTGTIGDPFAMSTVVTIVHTLSGQITSLDSQMIATPEPGSFALMGLALIGGLVWCRRRRS